MRNPVVASVADVAAPRNPSVAVIVGDMTESTGDAHTTSTHLDDAPDDVWDALTSPDGVEAWLGEGSRLSPVEGADLDVADVETGVRKVGRVDTVEPARRLGFVWWPVCREDDAGAAEPSRVVIELVPHGDGTHLTITESPIDVSMRARGIGGASACAARGSWAWRAAAVEVRLAAASYVLLRPSC